MRRERHIDLRSFDLPASAQARAGQAFVQQATAYFEDCQAPCNVAAFGTPPDHLPTTGAARRLP